MMIRLRPGLWLGEPEAIYHAERNANADPPIGSSETRADDIPEPNMVGAWYALTHSGREYAITPAERDALWAAFGRDAPNVQAAGSFCPLLLCRHDPHVGVCGQPLGTPLGSLGSCVCVQ